MRDNEQCCPDARKLLKVEVTCGKDCPMFSKCPRLILEDATDKAIGVAMKMIVRMINAKK